MHIYSAQLTQLFLLNNEPARQIFARCCERVRVRSILCTFTASRMGNTSLKQFGSAARESRLFGYSDLFESKL
jgi:hypothetical protein